MSLPPEVQEHVDRIRAILGVPACQLQINIDSKGVVQGVQTMVSFSRRREEQRPVGTLNVGDIVSVRSDRA